MEQRELTSCNLCLKERPLLGEEPRPTLDKGHETAILYLTTNVEAL